MSAYVLSPERHLTLPTWGENRSPALTYNWAIRRSDGSLVFRVESARFANEILANLNGDGLLRDHRGRPFPRQKSAA